MFSFNEISYVIYLPITLFITIWVGKELHKNGRPLMQMAFKRFGYDSWVSPVNNSLLIGYYLLNIGNLLIFINTWEEIESAEQMINAIAKNIGIIIIILGLIHVFNMTVLLVINFINTK
tara:strand:- start:589 stop:945 length:357 start_codon:yes stop_codon:yes gene_type:complete